MTSFFARVISTPRKWYYAERGAVCDRCDLKGNYSLSSFGIKVT